MLVYQHDGWLAVDAREIRQLCRSTSAIAFAGAADEPCELHAVLCHYVDNDGAHCRLALQAKALKRALIFAVQAADPASCWQLGREALAKLGFQLEDVNLKLSAAMREVVLRDLPGLATPAEADRQQQEKDLLLADLQATCAGDPGSSAGKKAAQKLKIEKRLQEHMQALRENLEGLLLPVEAAPPAHEGLVSQMRDLALRLESAETRAETERRRRLNSEAIVAAAEKRIRELEGILVAVETQSAEAVKQQHRILELQGQVAQLKNRVAAAEQQLNEAQAAQEPLLADARGAQERNLLLQGELQAAEKFLAKLNKRLGAEQADKEDLKAQLQAAGERVEALEKALEGSGKQAELYTDPLQAPAAFQAQLADVQQALQAAREQSHELVRELAAAAAEREALMAEVQESQALIDSLEERLRQSEQFRAGAEKAEAQRQRDHGQRLALEEKLSALEAQLARQGTERNELAAALAAAERRLAEQSANAAPDRAEAKSPGIAEPAVAAEVFAKAALKSAKSLPHELRPEPKPGAFFRPDWDLSGLPCQSAAQVHKAWETAFNVQISLEGYPSQYCMAFLVVLRSGRQKRLYMLFRLKQDKHTLVLVPAKVLKDEAALQKAIAEGLKFLKLSGFQMEAMAVENIDSALGSYFLPA